MQQQKKSPIRYESGFQKLDRYRLLEIAGVRPTAKLAIAVYNDRDYVGRVCS